MRLLVVAAIASAAFAFQNISPAVLLSTTNIDSLPSQFDATVGILAKDAICKYDAVVEHEELYATDHANLFKRQAASTLERPSLNLLTGEPTALTYTNTTLPVGGILKKYQLLTSELIVSLLVFLFIILPFALFSIKALASVQNPIRTDVTKTALSLERKNQ